MTMMESWIASAIFFVLVFVVGKYFQMKEKQIRMAKMLDSPYGPPPRIERRAAGRDRRKPVAPVGADVVAQR